MPWLAPCNTASNRIRKYLGNNLISSTDNTCVYPDLLHTFDVLRGNFVYKITPTLFQKGVSRPDYVRLSIVCMAISHRLNRTRDNLDSHTQCALGKTFLHYRGLIIRSLNEDVGEENKRTQDVVLAGIITLLLADVSIYSFTSKIYRIGILTLFFLYQGPGRQRTSSAMAPPRAPETNPASRWCSLNRRLRSCKVVTPMLRIVSYHRKHLLIPKV
jgi:hypothetical protein